MEGILVIFLFVGVIAITALLFGVWVFVSLLRLIFRGIAALFVPARPSRPHEIRTHANEMLQCTSAACRASNPSNARFCRRCGQSLPTVQRVAASRRAAIW